MAIKIKLSRFLSREVKLSKNYNSVSGSTGYGIEIMEVEVSSLNDKKIDEMYKLLDSIVEKKVQKSLDNEVKNIDAILSPY